MKHTLNLLLHLLISIVLGGEVAGIVYIAATHTDSEIIATVLAIAAFMIVAIPVYHHVSYAPEREGHTQLATAVENQDMRRIPRWWGAVPTAIAVLGGVLAWLLVR